MEKVSENIIQIGVNDYDIELFEGQYMLEKGMAYNSYLILDEKIAVMDTVDKIAVDRWMNNLIEGLAGKSVDYLVVQHMEPDHSAGISLLAEQYPQMKIVGNAKTFTMLHQFENIDLTGREIIVKEGESLCLGTHTLTFTMAPMVHWPEVMLTYESSEKVLFSADAFGKFGTRDADEDWDCEARRYYFNIVGKYGAQVQRVLAKAATLDIQTICPLHGPVLTEDLGRYIQKYNIWSKYEAETKGVFIACASIHGNTYKAAEKLKEILVEKGEERVVLADLTVDDIAECVEDAFRHDRLVLAAASYDAGVFMPMDDFLRRLEHKNYQKRKVALMENGSWGPTAGKCMKEILGKMKDIQLIEPLITIKSSMSEKNIEEMKALADALIAKEEE